MRDLSHVGRPFLDVVQACQLSTIDGVRSITRGEASNSRRTLRRGSVLPGHLDGSPSAPATRCASCCSAMGAERFERSSVSASRPACASELRLCAPHLARAPVRAAAVRERVVRPADMRPLPRARGRALRVGARPARPRRPARAARCRRRLPARRRRSRVRCRGRSLARRAAGCAPAADAPRRRRAPSCAVPRRAWRRPPRSIRGRLRGRLRGRRASARRRGAARARCRPSRATGRAGRVDVVRRVLVVVVRRRLGLFGVSISSSSRCMSACHSEFVLCKASRMMPRRWWRAGNAARRRT